MVMKSVIGDQLRRNGRRLFADNGWFPPRLSSIEIAAGLDPAPTDFGMHDRTHRCGIAGRHTLGAALERGDHARQARPHPGGGIAGRHTLGAALGGRQGATALRGRQA